MRRIQQDIYDRMSSKRLIVDERTLSGRAGQESCRDPEDSRREGKDWKFVVKTMCIIRI
ncbi:MAG: hypothetical protein ACLS5C_10085 [Waltera sp.]